MNPYYTPITKSFSSSLLVTGQSINSDKKINSIYYSHKKRKSQPKAYCESCLDVSFDNVVLQCQHVLCTSCNLEPEISQCCPICKKKSRKSEVKFPQLLIIEQ